MTEQNSADNTEFVLPIVCPHCSKQIDLSMMFALLPPKEHEIAINPEEDITTEET